MDAARRAEILKAYDGHLRRFNTASRRRSGTAAAVLRPPVSVVALAPAAGSRSKRQCVLSARQQEVLALVGDGLSNEEICGQLDITVETVKSHVQRILRRLGARNRAHAVTIAHKDGMLPRAAVAQSPGYSTRSR